MRRKRKRVKTVRKEFRGKQRLDTIIKSGIVDGAYIELPSIGILTVYKKNDRLPRFKN